MGVLVDFALWEECVEEGGGEMKPQEGRCILS